MSVVFFIPKYKNVGPVNVVNSIIASDFFIDGEIYIISFENENKETRLTINGKECFILSYNKYKFIKNYFKLKVLQKRLNFKVVHSHGFYPDLYSFFLRFLFFPAKFITTVHNYPYKDYSKEYGFFWGSSIAYFHLFLMKRLDLVVGCSESVSNYLSQYSVNSVSICNGVKLNVNDSYLKTPKKIKLVSIGRVIERKNPHDFCKYSLNKSQFIESLSWIGDGDLLPDLTIHYPKVKFYGHIENVAHEINKFDVLVSNSSAEGYPLAVLEFLSHGKPVVLSDIEPHREIKETLGKGVYIIKSNSFSELEKILENIQNNPIQFSVDDLYSISIEFMCDKYKRLYENIT